MCPYISECREILFIMYASSKLDNNVSKVFHIFQGV